MIRKNLVTYGVRLFKAWFNYERQLSGFSEKMLIASYGSGTEIQDLNLALFLKVRYRLRLCKNASLSLRNLVKYALRLIFPGG